jgi:hypothetical protein
MSTIFYSFTRNCKKQAIFAALAVNTVLNLMHFVRTPQIPAAAPSQFILGHDIVPR